MRFRPCIDLHRGKVKQIVGSTLTEGTDSSVVTNFTATKPSSWFADLYKQDKLKGGHVIMLGPGNERAAAEALSAWEGGLQIGGGITAENAGSWLEKGASHVIVTSYIFKDGQIYEERLKRLAEAVGSSRLVLDLSCRLRDGSYWVVTDRWQKFTQVEVNAGSLDHLSSYCAEFLIHAVDMEGKCSGIEQPLVDILGQWGMIPITYAGGISSLSDIETIETRGMGRLDFTVGSALDIFGGTALRYRDLVRFS